MITVIEAKAWLKEDIDSPDMFFRRIGKGIKRAVDPERTLMRSAAGTRVDVARAPLTAYAHAFDEGSTMRTAGSCSDKKCLKVASYSW